MKAVWEAQKEALRSHCEDVSPDNHVCCPNDPKKRPALALNGTGVALFEAFSWLDVGWMILQDNAKHIYLYIQNPKNSHGAPHSSNELLLWLETRV